jgi:hypothetical protein
MNGNLALLHAVLGQAALNERLAGYGVEPVVAPAWLFRHDAGVVACARLDRPALSQWCLQRLGSEPEQVLFEAGYLSQVIGLRLTDGRDVVVKVRAWQERLIGCGQVQHSLSVGGYRSAVVGAAGTVGATRGER